MEKKLQKIYLAYYNLLLAENLWQVHYQILSIAFLNEFMKSNVIIDMMIKSVKFKELNIKYKNCDCFLEYTHFKDDLTECQCLCCNKNYQQKFVEKLKEQVFNTHKFSNQHNNKFILLLQKGVYHYQYTDDCKKFNDKSLPEKEDFYSHINIEDITDADYAHAKRVCKDFEMKSLGEYHDLYV